MNYKRRPSIVSFISLALAVLFMASPAQSAPIPQDDYAATILAYHRIGEDAYPDTNIRLEQFKEHIAELSGEQYNILPLPAIVETLQNGEKLPEHSIAITFEGAYKSVYENAIPLLEEKGLPYTIFYASDLAAADTGQYMNWRELEQIKDSPNGTLGILPASYVRLKDLPGAEAERLINKAKSAYREHFDSEAKLFSYPFGEWSEALNTIIGKHDFNARFGLQSGVLYNDSDNRALPRFSVTENYADPERLNLITSALPLPVHDVTPLDPYIQTAPDESLTIGFTLSPQLAQRREDLRCYLSGYEAPKMEMLESGRIEIRPQQRPKEERIRINCTLPEGENAWRWTGFLFTQDVDWPQDPVESD